MLGTRNVKKTMLFAVVVLQYSNAAKAAIIDICLPSFLVFLLSVWQIEALPI
jgi:hypothetical protein